MGSATSTEYRVKLGFITNYTEERLDFASRAGFECLEISAEMGSALDLNVLDDRQIEEVAAKFRAKNVEIGTLQVSHNHLEGNLERRKEINAYFIKALQKAKRFGTNIVISNAWADRAKTPEQNLVTYKEVFSRYAEAAEKEDMYIAIENCPHWVGYPTPVGNIAYSPEMWDAMFDAVPSKRIGLEFDPSHLHWLGIDYVEAIKDYGDRIIAFHAKDTEILVKERSRYGIIGKQLGKTSEWDAGWWRYRIPGWGDIDWKGIFRSLNDIRYNGVMVIEHEDPVFGGPRTDEGLARGLRYLKQFA
jgi:sugar phosphate isomerase/epimerase